MLCQMQKPSMVYLFFIDNRYKLMIQMCLRDKSKSSLNENLDVNLYNVLLEMRHSVYLGKLKGICSYKYSGYLLANNSNFTC